WQPCVRSHDRTLAFLGDDGSRLRIDQFSKRWSGHGPPSGRGGGPRKLSGKTGHACSGRLLRQVAEDETAPTLAEAQRVVGPLVALARQHGAETTEAEHGKLDDVGQLQAQVVSERRR